MFNGKVENIDTTGSASVEVPLDLVLPAWDLLTGLVAVTGLLAASLRRDLTNEGFSLAIGVASLALWGSPLWVGSHGPPGRESGHGMADTSMRASLSALLPKEARR